VCIFGIFNGYLHPYLRLHLGQEITGLRENPMFAPGSSPDTFEPQPPPLYERLEDVGVSSYARLDAGAAAESAAMVAGGRGTNAYAHLDAARTGQQPSTDTSKEEAAAWGESTARSAFGNPTYGFALPPLGVVVVSEASSA